MTEKRQFHLSLLRLSPFERKDDFITVGVVLVEENLWFRDVRFTRDWRLLRCVAPHIELAWFEAAEAEVRACLKGAGGYDEFKQLVEEKFGQTLYCAPAKAIRAFDPVKEMEELASIYLAPAIRAEEPIRSGRKAIVYAMNEAFANAGVLDLMQTDLNMGEYTGSGDPFRIDFGYRVSDGLKMFHAVSLAASADQALALAYRYSRIQVGMRQENRVAALTAVAEGGTFLQDERNQFAIGMLAQNSVKVRSANEIEAIAYEVRVDMRM